MSEASRVPIDERWIVPSWPAPRTVRALMTTRDGGLSRGPWSGADGGGMNLGPGSGDDPATVAANRALLARRLPTPPAWLRQVHGIEVIDAALASSSASSSMASVPVADASFTTAPDRVCAVLVADCMPVLFCDRQGSRVAAAHAGWRGLLAGVLEATVRAAGFTPSDTLAWIGPAIGPTRFEVGPEVRDAFLEAAGSDRAATDAAFRAHMPGKWFADLPALARLRLAACGVGGIHASGLCTATDAARFYSYRRDGTTGRMAALVWFER